MRWWRFSALETWCSAPASSSDAILTISSMICATGNSVHKATNCTESLMCCGQSKFKLKASLEPSSLLLLHQVSTHLCCNT
eukprot:3344376-Amphidinium_carterae.1